MYGGYWSEEMQLTYSLFLLNPLMPGVYQKVIHTLTNLFKYVWPFSGHHALKD